MRFKWPLSKPSRVSDKSAKARVPTTPVASGDLLAELAALIERGDHQPDNLERLAEALGQDGAEPK